jgi:hypothetical protein
MITAPTLTKRLAVIAVLPALLSAGSAGAAPNRYSGVILNTPDRVVQGNYANVFVAAAPAGVRCSLTVKYANGARQKGLPARATKKGAASWRFQVPRKAAPGPARATAKCGAAGSGSRVFMVIGAVVPAHITVVKTGYSERTFTYGGSVVSWGAILQNDSPRDAIDVTVLANFVMPDNRLIGSMTAHTSNVPAGKQGALGGDLNFSWTPPIARLELVVTIRESGPASRAFPAAASVRVIGQPYDPAWVGSVEGEVQNDQAARSLQSVELGTVIMDASGNILGGATGFSYALLPPGAREFFKISGMSGIAMSNAASALVTLVPTYKTS